MIGDNTVVTILGVLGNRVRIGVAAPEAVPIWRGEVQRIGDRDVATAP